VLFILLIFVLLHSQLVFTPGVPIHLPEAEDLPGVIGRTVVVSWDASGQYYFDNQITHERLLRQRLAYLVSASHEPLILVVQADKDVTHEKSSGSDFSRVPPASKRPCWPRVRRCSRPIFRLSHETGAAHAAVLDLGFCFFLFLAHAAAIFRFSDATRPRRGVRVTALFYLSLDAKSDQRVAELTAGRDPTLFALPHARGFSGGAWLSFQPEIPKLSNWSAPPEWLALPLDQLGNSLHEYVATNRVAEEHLLSSLRAPKNVEVRIPDEPIITNTTVRVEGPLAARKLVGVLALPSATNTDVLRRTVVTVSVNGDGVVETASLARESDRKRPMTRGGTGATFAFERPRFVMRVPRSISTDVGGCFSLYVTLPVPARRHGGRHALNFR